MELASTALSPLCDRLIGLTIEEYVLLWNLKEEAESLKSTMFLIKSVLHDAEEKEERYEVVHVWLRQLKRILLDAEDILDEYATDACLRINYEDDPERKNKVRDIFYCFNYVQRILGDYDMARRIKAIKLKLDCKCKQKDELGLQKSVPRQYRLARPPTGYLLASPNGSYFSGRDEEREKIIHELLRLEEVVEPNVHTGGLQVLVIFGIGGVGKTTLVQLIFNDPRVEKHFQLMMWVCVSENLDLRKVTREIMEAALSSEETLLEISSLNLYQRKLKEKIEGKRFLLVLDDLWEEDNSKWEKLCMPLVHGAKGSKIMVTTRKQKTLNMVNGIPFPLEVMSNEALWPIFRRYTFGYEEPTITEQFEAVARKIVKKLKGLPLAARVIGRLLNECLELNRWRDILASEIFTLQQYDILHILKLSYDHLPMNLKQCFAYCSLFPKDYIFSKDEIILMWVAQNFITDTIDLHAEQVGHQSFEDLLSKSFFDLHVKRSSIESFKIHDLIHDLAELISKDDCFRLGNNDWKQMSENVCHVSVVADNFGLSKMMEVLNRENLRTLVFFHQSTFQLTPYLDDLFMKLKRLRILGLRRCKIEQLPSSIGKLKHLRFVDVSETRISNLPDSMSDLYNLQVLKLKSCRLLGVLPRNTSMLVNLRHLELDTEIASHVRGLRKLTALQELIVIGSKVGELVDMSMMKELRIWDLEGIASKKEALQTRLEAKEHLELLELNWNMDDRPRQWRMSEEEEVVMDALKPKNCIRQLYVRFYEGVRSPKWMEDPSWFSTSHLEKLELYNCTKWEVLPPLGQLPGLKFLTISRMSGVRSIGSEFFSCCDDGRGGGGVILMLGFPSLEELVFTNMPRWKVWKSPVVEQRQPPLLFLPQLRKLHLNDCPKLRELPPLPPSLTTLSLGNVGITHLPEWMTPPASSSSPSLSSFEIYDCPNLTSLDHGLLQRRLPMLKELRIKRCDELASLSYELSQHLRSLEELTVAGCHLLRRRPALITEGHDETR